MPGVPILLRELERIEKELGLGPGTTAAVEEPIPSAPPPPPPEAEHSALDRHIAIMERDAGREPPSPKSRPALYAAAALVLAVLGIGAADFWGITDLTGNFINSRIERGLAAARTQPAPAPLPPVVEAPKEKAPPPVAEEKVAEKKAEVAEPEMPPPPPAPVAAPLREEPKSVAVAPPPPPPVSKPIAKAPVPVSKPIAKAPAPQREATARLILSVSPRGELYVDGEHHGTTPPVTSLEIEPGLHRIEVRSGSRKPFLTYVTMEPGDVRRIRHDFNARPLRPPG
jgi:hypothetical protein